MKGDVLLYVRSSRIHGRGCFAAATITRGAVIIEYLGEYITREEAIRRNDSRPHKFGAYILKIHDELFLDGIRSGNQARFINHACVPNCYVRTVRKRAFIVAASSIHNETELTIDYDFEREFREACSCGLKTCRGYM